MIQIISLPVASGRLLRVTEIPISFDPCSRLWDEEAGREGRLSDVFVWLSGND